MEAIIASLMAGEAKVVGTTCPKAAAFLRRFIAHAGLDATVKLMGLSEMPDLATTYPYDN